LAAKAGVTRFIQMSAIGADAQSDSLYARSKGEAERAVRAAISTATILRPSIVFGQEDDFFNKFATMATMTPAFVPLPLLIGGGKAKFQPVYVDDVADAVCAALARPEAAGKTYELGGPRVYSFRELLELMLAETGHRRMLLPVPFALAPAMGFAGEMIGALPMFDPPITRDQIKLLKHDNIVGAQGEAGDDIGRIEDLGVRTETLEAVLPGYMVRFRKYGQFTEKLA
ncbi:MAG: complex I NDUFA9 subunit family protein, partial [Parvularculaceae bacterium]|nr:complex I NDUFA9 subunit family protein [Parvularculaceae bacterium]